MTHVQLIIYVFALALIALTAGGAALVVALWRRKRIASTGTVNLVGSDARAVTALDPEGFVCVRGEMWRARALSGYGALARGVVVRVTGARGHLLEVESVD